MMVKANPAIFISNLKYKQLEEIKDYLKKIVPENEQLATVAGDKWELLFGYRPTKSRKPLKVNFEDLAREITKRYDVDVKVSTVNGLYSFLQKRVLSQPK